MPDRLIRHVVQEFHSQLTAADFSVTINVPPTLPPIRADRPAMSLAIGNLVDNAMRYSADCRTLTMSARLEASHIAIDVADSGIGIPAHELSRVTHRFFRGEGAVAGGSGLGLAIVQRIVSDHAGTLAIASQQGTGTTVTLTLPHAGVERETTHSDS
ncbi:MAG: ATP-binding protein [Vicinamibacterales bacterium]